MVFQNPGNAQSDREIWKQELQLVLQAEALGFDSVWGVEHHFTDYTMSPDVLQFLTYVAGKTQRVRLGSMVVVLPWHDPMRVAEQISLLDHVSDGRFIFGMGRGLGRVEFDGFGVPMENSRGLFDEGAEMILKALETGTCEYDGKYVQQPRRDIRPRPFKSFKDRAYVASVSPETLPVVAKLGAGILIIPQKPWPTVLEELQQYRGIFRELHGREAPAPICAAQVFCDEDAARAEDRAQEYMGAYYESVDRHYEFSKNRLATTKGYESYKATEDMTSKEGGPQRMREFYTGLQVFGTPAQCYERASDILKRVGSEHFIAGFSYGGMPHDEANRNMQLFATQVLPELKKLSL